MGYGQLVIMLITLESHGIFRSNFAYLFILTLFNNTGMQNGDEAPFFKLDNFSTNRYIN